MGVVLRARDRVTGRDVAVKWISVTEARRAAVEQELRISISQRHPNVVMVHEFGFPDAGHAFIAMELIDGDPFDVYARGRTVADVMEVASGVVSALEYLHRRGLVHGDLKPGNVLVSRAGDPVAKLLDFGLASPAVASASFSGTPAYLAPEVAKGASRDIRSDLYSLGVLLYEALSGANPFDAPSVIGCLDRHASLSPPLLGETVPGVPLAVSQLVARLLEKDPARRFGTPSETLKAVHDIFGAELLEGDSRDASRMVEPTLVGREHELERIDAGIEAVAGGQGVIIVVSGEMGSGKSALCQEIAVRARLAGMRCAVAVCRETDRMLAPLAVGLELAFGPDALNEADLDARAPTGRLDVVRIADRVAALAGDEPLAIVIDNVHLGDRELLAVVARLQQLAMHQPLLVAWSVDSAALPRPPVADVLGASLIGAEALGRVDTVALGRLSLAETQELLTVCLGGPVDPERLSVPLFEATGGRPLYVLEMVRHLSARRQIVCKSGMHRLRTGQTLHAEVGAGRASRLDVIARARVADLDDASRAIYEALAVAGCPMSIEELAGATGLGDREILALVASLQADTLTRTEERQDVTMVVVSQPAFGAAVEGHLTAERRRHLHCVLADVISRPDPSDADTLARIARHRAVAGDAAGALRDGRRAAELAERSGSRGLALDTWRMLRSTVAEGTPSEDRAEIHEQLGRLLHENGYHAEAADALRAAMSTFEERPGDPGRWIRLLCQTVESLARLGRADEARVALADLHEATESADATHRVRARLAAAETLRLLGSLDDAAREATRALEDSDADAPAKARALLEIATIESQQAHLEDSARNGRQALELFTLANDVEGQASACLILGSSLRLAGKVVEAMESFGEALGLYDRLSSVSGSGKAHNNLGVCHYMMGDWERAADHWQEAIRLAELSGEVAEKVVLLNNLGYLYMERALFDRAERALREGLAAAARTQTQRLEAVLCGNLGEVRARQGALEEAHVFYRSAIEVAERLGSRSDVVESQRRTADLLLDQREYRQAADLANQVLQEALALSLSAEQGHLYRILGVAATQERHHSQATAYFDRALRAFGPDSQGGELVQLQLARAELLEQTGAITRALALAREAVAAAERLGAVWHLQTGRAIERRLLAMTQEEGGPSGDAGVGADFLRVLAAIQGAPDPQEAAGLLLDHVIERTGAERGIVAMPASANVEALRVTRSARCAEDVWHGEADGLSRTVAQLVLDRGQTICRENLLDDQAISSAASIVALNLRSLLCVPIPVSGSARALLYLDSQVFVGNRFSRIVGEVEALARALGATMERSIWEQRYRAQVEIVGWVAHELRAPLTSILGFSTLCAREVDIEQQPEPVRALVEVVDSQGKRMTRLVRDMRNLWQATHRPVAVVSQVEVRAVLEAAALALSPAADEAGVRLVVQVPRGLPAIRVDEERVQQVITNLVTNALRHSPAGGTVTLSADLSRKPGMIGEGQMIEFAVTDEGSGLSEDDIVAVFTKFSRGSRPRGEGSGLGLTIVQQIVRGHGGDVWAESELGHGARFCFTLPVVFDAAAV